MLAKDVMQKDPIAVSTDTTIEEVAQLMIRHAISGFPVVDASKKVVGVVSEMDLMRKEIKPHEPGVWQVCVWGVSNSKVAEYADALRKYMAKTAGEIMTSPAVSVEVDEPLETVGNLMFEKKIKRVIVTDRGRLAGVISRSAFTKLFLDKKTL